MAAPSSVGVLFLSLDTSLPWPLPYPYRFPIIMKSAGKSFDKRHSPTLRSSASAWPFNQYQNHLQAWGALAPLLGISLEPKMSSPDSSGLPVVAFSSCGFTLSISSFSLCHSLHGSQLVTLTFRFMTVRNLNLIVLYLFRLCPWWWT